MTLRRHIKGLSMVEVLGSLAIGALLIAALAGVAAQATRSRETLTAAMQLQRDGAFALERMARAARASRRLLVPAPERAGTAYSEAVRPLLAVTLDPTLDRNSDGFPDADNDRDGRIDEDLDEDATSDGFAGIIGVDDDGDGNVDEGGARDDDEDGSSDEDKVDGLDNDGDGRVDEDAKRDMSDDSASGLKGVDDDGDSAVDEDHDEDDDEDGLRNEDWLDAVVYRLEGDVLLERLPEPNAANGAVFVERPIATGVSSLQVRYVAPVSAGRPALLEITLALTDPSGATASLATQVRIEASP